MTRYVIVDLAPAHIHVVARNLRDGDRAEVEATGLTPQRALWQSYRASHIRRAALVDGKVAAVWGCSGPLMAAVGHPWLMTTAAIEAIPVSFVREARSEVAAMLAVHPRLINFVAARYTRALRFLEALGFAIGGESDALRVGARAELFLPFHKARA